MWRDADQHEAELPFKIVIKIKVTFSVISAKRDKKKNSAFHATEKQKKNSKKLQQTLCLEAFGRKRPDRFKALTPETPSISEK